MNSTTDVASLTTPSPNTKLYKKGVSSWFNTCNVHTESVAENIAPSAEISDIPVRKQEIVYTSNISAHTLAKKEKN